MSSHSSSDEEIPVQRRAAQSEDPKAVPDETSASDSEQGSSIENPQFEMPGTYDPQDFDFRVEPSIPGSNESRPSAWTQLSQAAASAQDRLGRFTVDSLNSATAVFNSYADRILNTSQCGPGPGSTLPGDETMKWQARVPVPMDLYSNGERLVAVPYVHRPSEVPSGMSSRPEA